MNQNTRIPLMLAASMAFGILIGSEFLSRFKYGEDTSGNVQKFRDVLNYIDRYYVDTVDLNLLTEYAIEEMLHKLDPHTSYISAEESTYAFSQLETGFDGIGIEFNIYRDTLKVLAVTQGGPSEKAGLQAGDRIIAVNDTPIAGVKMATQDIVGLLRGAKGSEVTLTILRPELPTPFEAIVTRANIPTESVALSYMLNDTVGYLQIAQFARNTHEQFKEALMKLRGKGMQHLVLDLRNNSGGYLNPAVKIADEFLAGKKEIVYTKGKENRFNQEEYAEHKGLFETGGLVVLINENSASASELLAGALQDYDRALIVGRRSFGKGLVQLPITLPDESILRLTISRYYTPSGRSIQKPYEDGIQAYRNEVNERYRSGEVFNMENFSIENPKNTFYTEHGRQVYGGGGIMPDYFLPVDTSAYSSLWQQMSKYDLIRDFAHSLTNELSNDVASSADVYRKRFTLSETQFQKFERFLKLQGISVDLEELAQARPIISNRTRAYLGRKLYGDTVYNAILHEQDTGILKAIQVMQEARQLPGAF